MTKHHAPLLHTIEHGDPSLPTVILLHGLMGSWRTWHHIIEQLSGHYHFVSIDLLGFGDSPKPRVASYSKKEHIEALVETLKHYKFTSPHMVVGFSLGAVLATHLLKTKYIKTDRLLLIAAPIYGTKGEMSRRIKRSPTPAIFRNGVIAQAAHTVRRKSTYMTRLLAKVTHPNVPKIVVDDLTKVPYYAYIRTRKKVLEKETVINKLPKVKYASILVGSHDMYADVSYLAQLAGKTGTLDIARGVGHSIPFTNPELVTETIVSLSKQTTTQKTKVMRDL